MDATGEQKPEGFPGILVFAREEGFEDEIKRWAKGLSPCGIFPGKTLDFHIRSGEREKKFHAYILHGDAVCFGFLKT